MVLDEQKQCHTLKVFDSFLIDHVYVLHLYIQQYTTENAELAGPR